MSIEYYDKYLKYKKKYLDKVKKGGAGEEIKVLTWNVCFGCMLANHESKNDKNSLKLASHCKDNNTQGKNKCVENVKSIIFGE
jgi:hypothetical protein